MKIYIEHASMAYVQMFTRLGYEVVHDHTLADIFCFTGGEDVSAIMYGDQQHPFTGNNPWRDQHEAKLFQYGVEHDKRFVGICRGGQFLNVMCGGRMYQHVTGHGGGHCVTDLATGETVYVSSTHHQMMMPSAEAVVLATSRNGGTREWYDGDIFKKDVSDEDIEVVYYPHRRALCFQPHPEFDGVDFARMTQWFGELMLEYVVKE